MGIFSRRFHFAVLVLVGVLPFQNCSRIGFKQNSQAQTSTKGGEGFDGKPYVNLDVCNQEIDKANQIDVALDFKSAKLVRKDCLVLDVPAPVDMSEIAFSARDPDVFTWHGKVFDRQTGLTSQRVTQSLCTSDNVSPAAETQIWSTLDDPQSLFGNLRFSNGVTSGSERVTASTPSRFQTAPGPAAFELTLNGPLNYSLPSQPSGTISPMTCATQRPRVLRVQSRSGRGVGGSGSYTFLLGQPLSANSLVTLGISLLHASTSCVTGLRDNTPGGSQSYLSTASFASEANAGSSEIWYVPNSRPGATSITVDIDTACSADPPAFFFGEFSGLGPVDPYISSTTTISSSAVTTVAAPLVAGVSSSALVFSVASVEFEVTGLESLSPYESLNPANGDGAAYLVSNGAPTRSAVWNQPSAGSFCASTVVFKAPW